MKYQRFIISFSVLFILFCGCHVTFASKNNPFEKGNNSEIKQPENLEIYLLIGQSNMAGRAPIEKQDSDTLKNVFLFTGIDGNEWEKAANPLNKYSTVRKDISSQKLGPGYTFAREMAKASDGNQIGLVVNAKGGTAISEWKPGSTLYNEAVKQTKKALKFGILKGIVWHQGEGDASKFDKYMPKIIELIEDLRTEFGNADLPFVAGQLSEDRVKRIDFNKMILELPAEVNHTGVATSGNMATIDSTHFNSASQRLLGERYAAEMLKLIQN